jgi:RHS repeat-associated protein
MSELTPGLARALGALGLGVVLLLAPGAGRAQLTHSQTVTGGITSGATIVLPAWTPAPNDLVLVAVALRDETRSVTVSGNGLSFVEVANLDNAQAQTGVNLFRAMGASPTAGSITVTISGNSLPAVASATRISGAESSGTNGSGAIEAVATNAGPPVTDDDDMKINVTTLTSNAWAYAAGTHRLATFTVPAGETAVSINNVAGSDGDKTTLSTWYEATPTAGTLTLGADNDLNSARDWAVIAVSIKPADPAQGPVTVGAGIASGATITLPAWSPGANELVLVAVALRDETKPVSVSGNGLTFVEIANLDNAQAQTGVNLFRAMGASPAAGSITVTISGNTLPAVASATRFPGVDASGTNGSGAIEAVATHAGPPVTDDRNMKVEITTLSNNARAYAAGTHRLATFTVPAGETAISINNVAGTSGDMTTLSTWYEAVATPGTLTLGADNDLNSARDWALVAVSIKAAAAGNAAPTVSLTSPVSGESFQAPASVLTVAATAQDADGTIAQVEFFANGNLIGGATASPFTIQWVNVVAADYALTAKATDNLGAQTTSAAVNISVRVPQVFFVHTDHLDTPRLIANGASQTVWTWANDDPFGANVPNENPSGLGAFTCNLRLPGQYFDKETNLHYNMARDYDSGIGAFIQPEPLGLAGDINLYRYARSNPLSVIDPDGRQPTAPNQNPAAACSYYDSVCSRTNRQCFYYCVTGSNICRYPYASPFLWGVPQEKVNCIRTCLIREDQQAWGNPQNLTKGCPSCVKDSVIDAYHDKCYTSCGVSTSRYPGVRPGGIPLGNE